MAKTFTLTDLELLGYHSAQLLTDPSLDYALYTAKVVAGLRTEQHAFLYLKSSCTNDQFKEALQLKPRPEYVVIPHHQQDRMKKLRSLSPEEIKVFVYEEIIWERVSSLFAEYLTALTTEIPTVDHYVTPRPVDNAHNDLDQDIIQWLTRSTPNTEHQLRVLRAPAGVGKTTVARHITRRLAEAANRHRIIPVYVEAAHWAKMSVDSLDDLWTTIDNSLRHFDPAIRVSKELFDHLLRQGDIVFIFDGFDELCGHRLSPLKAIDILNELRSGVSSASDARVLLTSRTVYWDEEVGSEVAGIGITDLATFTKPQAFDYFEQRFRDDPVTRERARQLFGELRKGNQPPTPGGGYKQFPYHPLVIQLVADAATHGIDELPGADEGRSPVLRVLRIFCEREIVRQKLNTSSDAQLRAFQDMAVELFLDGTDSLAIEIDDLLIAGFDERDRPKLPDHPFVLRSASGHYCFRYEFLVNLLVARHIVHSLQAVRGDTWSGEKRTLRIMDQLRSGKHSVLDHIGDIWTSEISKLGEAMALIPPNLLGARSFIFQLTKHLVNIHEHLSLRADRSDRVLTLLGAARTKDGLEVSSLYIVGNVEKFDLSRIRFNRCTFIDVQFIDCQADESTIFDHCIFEGELELSGSREMWGKVKRNDCRMDSIVKLVWSDVDAHSRKYDDDVLHEALAAALGKFWKHAHLKGSISASDWNSGVLGRLQIASKLKDIMMRVGLIKPITISGVSEGGYAIDREAIACIQQFMDNRQLTGKVADVYRELKKS